MAGPMQVPPLTHAAAMSLVECRRRQAVMRVAGVTDVSPVLQREKELEARREFSLVTALAEEAGSLPTFATLLEAVRASQATDAPPEVVMAGATAVSILEGLSSRLDRSQ